MTVLLGWFIISPLPDKHVTILQKTIFSINFKFLFSLLWVGSLQMHKNQCAPHSMLKIKHAYAIFNTHWFTNSFNHNLILNISILVPSSQLIQKTPPSILSNTRCTKWSCMSSDILPEVKSDIIVTVYLVYKLHNDIGSTKCFKIFLWQLLTKCDRVCKKTGHVGTWNLTTFTSFHYW